MPAGLLLALLSFGLSVGLIAVVGRAFLHLEWRNCFLIGTALGCTSGAIVMPVLEQIDASDPVRVILTIESSLGEVIAVLVVGGMIGIPHTGARLMSGLAADFSQHVAIAVGVGVVAGAIWSRVWPLVAGQLYSNILNLGVVLGVFAFGHYADGSGLLAELIFGITLGNMPRTPHMIRQGTRMLAVHAELSFLVRSFFFVVLGVVAKFISPKYILPILAILAASMIARFLAVQGGVRRFEMPTAGMSSCCSGCCRAAW